MYPMFKLWIRSHADLPLKTYQIVNIFRYETKQTRPFIRIREIHFFEAHTCHADYEDAERQIQEDLEIMAKVGQRLCIPYVINKRPEWDKFPGAFYSLGADCLMPNGRALQIGTIHEYKENFSKPYEITYEAESGEHKHVHQTTYGMSERLLGAIIGIFGDDKGLVLPPDIAPFQVVVVPIFDKDSKEKVLGAAMKIFDDLRALGLRVHMDDRDMRPGAKFYHWEFLGVPVRIELGPKDMAKNVVTIFRRDLGKKGAAHEGIVRMAWCGSEACAKAMEEGSGKGVLGTSVAHEGKKGACAVCGKETTSWAHLANTY
jgi:prolyl-tRNA synthetase